MKKVKNIEMQIYEMLGVKTFRNILFSIQYFLFNLFF